MLKNSRVYSALTGTPIYADEVTDNIQTAYLSAGPAQIRLKNGSPEYVVLDALGSPVASSTSGAFTWRELYTPFGEKTLPPAANDNDIGFTGHVQDEASGLTYMQARFYDPVIGRFLSTDPIGYQDQLNLYAYVHNDPVNGTDPTGLQCAGCYGDTTGATEKLARARNNAAAYKAGGAYAQARAADTSARQLEAVAVGTVTAPAAAVAAVACSGVCGAAAIGGAVGGNIEVGRQVASGDTSVGRVAVAGAAGAATAASGAVGATTGLGVGASAVTGGALAGGAGGAIANGSGQIANKLMSGQPSGAGVGGAMVTGAIGGASGGASGAGVSVY